MVGVYRSVSLTDHTHTLQQYESDPTFSPYETIPDTLQLILPHTHSLLQANNELLTNNGFVTEIVGDTENFYLHLVSETS